MLPTRVAGRGPAARLFGSIFATLFSRADQARWFGVYLRGLLGPGDRKERRADGPCRRCADRA